MPFLRPKRIGGLIREGDDAQRRKDWHTAYRCYAEIVAIRPDRIEIWIQLGHVAKEIARDHDAEQAYREALRRGGGDLDVYVQLGDLLRRRGRRDEAIAVYSDALRFDPDAIAPLRNLVSLGARDSIPDTVFAPSRQERLKAELARKTEELEALNAVQTELSIFPLRRYDAFRRAHPVPPPPPQSCTAANLLVVVDARDSSAAGLRSTLISLLDQSIGEWRACVRPSPSLFDHPVASFAFTEPRISFLDTLRPDTVGSSNWVVSVSAGVMLDPHCLAWLAIAASLVEAPAFFADYDHLFDDPVIGTTRSNPQLFGVFDPYVMVQIPTPPPILMIRADAWSRNSEFLEVSASEMHRRTLLAAYETDAVAHIPRILGSIVEMSEVVRNAPQDGGGPDSAPATSPIAPPIEGKFHIRKGLVELRAGAGADPVAVATPRDNFAELRIVMPSRDAPVLLRSAVDSLFERSAYRDRIRVTVVDNRSSDPDALALLEDYRRRGIDVLAMDEPFNWSRANNLAAAASREPYLVFVNNDTEMLTQQWDCLLTGYLERDDIGAVGARLLYPDRTLQHGGALFLGGSPRHEGVGVAENEAGPLGRWAATRVVGAVTGAFLAVRRDRFEAVGGFDEKRLAIAFNDIDFCLKIRSHGWRILYAAALEMIHHESKTRGINNTRGKVAWDIDEFRTLRERWGDALSYDPGYNPQWTDGPMPFDGWQEPSMQRVIDHIRRSAEPDPWRVASPL